ncbi:MAG: Stf0 sulfotransferase family protein, partial [Actinomycetota bacterium]|nr:Stf0 sulfotransferase family protein [Actinomycetota bacterium]
MPSSPAYLVLASQRSGSTLLVESLRATGVAG